MKIKPIKKEFYLNPIAQLFLQNTSLTKTLIAGRGFGKSFINGIQVIQHVRNMPRSRGVFLGATFTQILTNTLLPMKAAWGEFGYYEGVHYVISKRPPSYFAKPYMNPDRFENVISWWNGTTVVLASMDRPALNRGGNNDWSIVDEALLIKRDEYDRNISPSIRGSHTSFKNKIGHLSESFTSSMPYGSVGKWLLDMKDISSIAVNNSYYIEGTSWHNRVVLGDKVLNKWKRTMSPIIYGIEIMNKSLHFGNLFYPSLTEQHFYTDSYDYSYIDSLPDSDHSKKDSRWDVDVLKDQPLNISHDWGKFNCLTVDQYHRSTNTVRFLNYMYVHKPDILDDLAQQFCNYYRHHTNKTVLQWGDKSGAKKEANARLSMFNQFADILRKQGWRVIRKKIGDAGHLARHHLINQMHRNEFPSKIEYNANNCKDLRIALESAGMKGDKKDKSSENKDNIKQEHATHGTDAHDYRLYWGFVNHTQQGQSYTSPISIR